MESVTKTNRKGFLKRTGLAIGSVFALTKLSAASSSNPNEDQSSAASAAGQSPGTAGSASSAFARVRTAKGAVARKSDRIL